MAAPRSRSGIAIATSSTTSSPRSSSRADWCSPANAWGGSWSRSSSCRIIRGSSPSSSIPSSSRDRTSSHSFVGLPRAEALAILERVRRELGVPVLTDVHAEDEVADAAEVADVLQVPAFLSRQTSLLQAVAKSGRAVNVKKGQFLAPDDIAHVVEKLTAV